MNVPSFIVIIPTLNAAAEWPTFASALLRALSPSQVLILDSSSTDGTPELARAAGFHLRSIARSDFNHGGSRQLAAEMFPEAEVIVYLTQDATIESPDAIRKLLMAFEDPTVAAAYGRQLPRTGAGPIESHARSFNYPAEPSVRDLAGRDQWGFKTIFISNSFAAYRSSALRAVGGFPTNVIFGEDTITAARLVLGEWKIAYVPEARIHHSHGYTWTQEFKRYFDIGVLHHRESWLGQEFGHAGGEGRRFFLSELKWLWPNHAMVIPSAMIRTGLKLLGYRLGRLEEQLSVRWKLRLSMHPGFWRDGDFKQS